MRTLALYVTTAAFAAFSAPSASATSLSDLFTGFFVFGDSLSDIGNLGPAAPPPPYFDDRFSNGLVWADIVADAFVPGTTTQNYAFGGSTAIPPSLTSSLPEQIGLFQADLAGLDVIPGADPSVPPTELFPGTPTPGDRPLAALWFGANDIFRVFNAIRAVQDDDLLPPEEKAAQIAALQAAAPGQIVAAANAVVSAITSLNGLGFADFVIFDLPDLGKTPAYLGTAAAVGATALSLLFNDTLNAGLLTAGPDVNVTKIGVFDIFASIFAGDGPIAPAVLDMPCFVPPTFDDTGAPVSAGSLCTAPETYLFWDGVHPTATAHAALADIVKRELGVIPVGPTLPLLAGALSGLAVVRRRAA